MTSTKLPQISVVIPAFNAGKYISSCLESVLAQTFSDLEVVIVDDGSTDNTLEIISACADDRVRLYTQANSGSAAARNKGVQEARGEWIAFIDADDIWAPEKLEKQLTTCQDKVWSHTDSYYIGGVYAKNTKASDLCRKHAGDVFEELLVENSVGTSCVMIKKTCFDEFAGFDTSYRALQDWGLWLRVASKYPIGYCDEPLVSYRVHTGSTSRSTRKTLPFHVSLIEHTFSPAGVAYEHQQLKSRALAKSYGICSYISEQEGDFSFACYCAAKSLFCRPLTASAYLRFAKICAKSLIHYLQSPFRRGSSPA